MSNPAHETPTERKAAGLESDRVDREVAVEAARSDRAEAIEVTRADLAAILEEDRKRHNIRMEQRLKEQTRRTARRFLALFAAIVLIFGLLAYRTEVNANQTKETARLLAVSFYEACTTRVERQILSNKKREQLVETATANIKDPPAREAMKAQLRDGLFLPIESCGEPPP